MPWHTCCDPVILAAPYVIDLHHDTVARDQLAHLAEVLHEYLEKSPGVVDSAWVRQHLWRRMGISFLLTREYKHLAPPCLHGEFQTRQEAAACHVWQTFACRAYIGHHTTR